MSSSVIAAPARVRSGPRLSVTVLVGGVVVLIAGTFLPWLQSGKVDRNSYAAGGAARRLLGADGALDTALAAWPFVSFAGAVAVALVLLRWFAPGAAVAVVAAAAAGTVAVLALAVDGSSLVRPAHSGPAVTLAGAVLIFVAVIVRPTPFDVRLWRTR